MSFLDHLEALRWHLVRSAIALFAITIVVFLAKDFVFNTIIFGPTRQDFVTFRTLCAIGNLVGSPEALCMEVTPIKWITPVFGETFIIHMQVSLILGFVVAFPYIFWELWRFVQPALYETEQRAARGTVAICSSLFLTGVAFGYFMIAPIAVSFLINYELPGVEPQPALSSYITYLTLFTLPSGVIFELPVLVFFLTKVGLVSSALMKEYRRHAVVVLLVVSAIITPPDPLTLMMLGVPLYSLYELSILIAQRVERRQVTAEKALAKLN